MIWHELLDKGKKDKTPVILVIDDKKEDWWQIHKKMTIGPRPELRHEMMAKANVEFYMYQSGAFMQHAEDYLESKVNHKAIEEVEAARGARRDEEKRSQELHTATAILTAHGVYPKSLLRMAESTGREVAAAGHAVAPWFRGLSDAELAAVGTLSKQATMATAATSSLQAILPEKLLRYVMESRGMSNADARKWISRQLREQARPVSTPGDADVDHGEGSSDARD